MPASSGHPKATHQADKESALRARGQARREGSYTFVPAGPGPHRERTMPNRKMPAGNTVVFLAILVAGVVLVCVAHTPVASIPAFAAGLSTLYAAFRQNNNDDDK